MDASILFIRFRCADKRRRDVDGMLSTALDSLVRQGFLPDDSSKYLDRIVATSVYAETNGIDFFIFTPAVQP